MQAVAVIARVIGGVLCGYLGYWLGHLFGWSTEADWPFTVGGGEGAILLAIALAVAGVLVVGAAVDRVLGRRRRGAAPVDDRQPQSPAGV